MGFMPSSPNPEFLRRAIALATENVVSGAGGPFGAVDCPRRPHHCRGRQHRNRHARPYGPRRSHAIPRGLPRLWESSRWPAACSTPVASLAPCGLAAAWWARLDTLYYGASAKTPPAPAFDDAFLYDELRKPLSARKLPATQLLSEEAWASFASWIASAHKIALLKTHLALPPGARLYCEPCKLLRLTLLLAASAFAAAQSRRLRSGRCRSRHHGRPAWH